MSCRGLIGLAVVLAAAVAWAGEGAPLAGRVHRAGRWLLLTATPQRDVSVTVRPRD